MLTIDFSDVGIILRPKADVIFQRLKDCIPDLKSHLSLVYKTPVAVLLTPPPPEEERRDMAGELVNGNGSAVLHPIEQTLIDLFNARKVTPNS